MSRKIYFPMEKNKQEQEAKRREGESRRNRLCLQEL